MEKLGVISVLGEPAYRLEITYTKMHSVKDCAMCKIMRNHDSAEISGPVELGTALTEILAFFQRDIMDSEMYSHCERIGITVMRQFGSDWHCDAQYEIKKGK